MFWKKKTFEESMRDLDKELAKEGVARDYDRLSNHISDNAYLYYINHKLGWNNKLLGDLKTMLVVTNIALIVLVMTIIRIHAESKGQTLWQSLGF
jgi:hypothetical protein